MVTEVTTPLLFFLFLDLLLGAAFGFEEASGVAAGACGGGAFGFGFFGGWRDGFVGCAADDLGDVAFDAFGGGEFGFGVGARGHAGGFWLGGFEFGFGDFLADAFEGIEGLGVFDAAHGGEFADTGSRGGGHFLGASPVP